MTRILCSENAGDCAATSMGSSGLSFIFFGIFATVSIISMIIFACGDSGEPSAKSRAGKGGFFRPVGGDGGGTGSDCGGGGCGAGGGGG